MNGTLTVEPSPRWKLPLRVTLGLNGTFHGGVEIHGVGQDERSGRVDVARVEQLGDLAAGVLLRPRVDRAGRAAQVVGEVDLPHPGAVVASQRGHERGSQLQAALQPQAVGRVNVTPLALVKSAVNAAQPAFCCAGVSRTSATLSRSRARAAGCAVLQHGQRDRQAGRRQHDVLAAGVRRAAAARSRTPAPCAPLRPRPAASVVVSGLVFATSWTALPERSFTCKPGGRIHARGVARRAGSPRRQS